MTFLSDYTGYFEVLKIATGNLGYNSVERVFYLTPGRSMAEGLHQIRDDVECRKMVVDGKLGVVTLFFEATKFEAVVGDNEDPLSDGDMFADDSDPEAENSVVGADVGIVHLIDDSDRTSDEEFVQAMEDLGIANRIRRIRTRYDSHGMEVSQVIGVSVNLGHPASFNEAQPASVNKDGPDEIEVDGGRGGEVNSGGPHDDTINLSDDDHHDDDEMNASDEEEEEDPEYAPPPPLNASPVSSYRGSSQSAHKWDDKIDGDEVSSIVAQLFYDPKCDHSKLVFKEGLKFIYGKQFKKAFVNHSIAVGAEIRWKRSNKLNREAICSFNGCKWKVYASWFGRNVAFIVKAMGEAHSCPRSMHNRNATSKWIARQYLSRFRMYPELDTIKLVQEIRETYGVEVSVRVTANAKTEARKMLQGSLTEAYAKLRPYILQLKESDPEGKFIVKVDPVDGKNYVLFKRIYIGFSCLRKGFLSRCRKMFALDGCFLKGKVPDGHTPFG
ncbi:hypothetical protein LINGRAHAP2_LOCUS11413 [Linum grandiflorum]